MKRRRTAKAANKPSSKKKKKIAKTVVFTDTINVVPIPHRVSQPEETCDAKSLAAASAASITPTATAVEIPPSLPMPPPFLFVNTPLPPIPHTSPYNRFTCQLIAEIYDFWTAWMYCMYPTCTCGKVEVADHRFVPPHKRNGMDPLYCTVHALHGPNAVRWCCVTRRSEPHAKTCPFDPKLHAEMGYVELIAQGYLVPPRGKPGRRLNLYPRLYLFDLVTSHPGFVCSCDDVVDCPYRHDVTPSPHDLSKVNVDPLVVDRVTGLLQLEHIVQSAKAHNRSIDRF